MRAIRAEQARIVCLGVRLRPLTVGHLFVLLEHDNAYPDHPERAEWPDLLEAILVCSQTHRRAGRMLASGFAPTGMKLWGFLTRKKSWRAESCVFLHWLREQLGTPAQDDLGVGGELRAPLCWRLLAMLMADFRFSRAQALKTPVAFALCLWATEADRRGTGKLASERQVIFRNWVQEQERIRIEKEQGNPS